MKRDLRLEADLSYMRALAERLNGREEGFWEALDCLMELATMIPVCEQEYGKEAFTPFLFVYELFCAFSERLAFYDQAVVPSEAVAGKLRESMLGRQRWDGECDRFFPLLRDKKQ